MGARTGEQYLQGLRDQPRELWLGGERVDDITAHPALGRTAKSVAALYDMQHLPELVEEMTYISPTSGQRVGRSFLAAQSGEELVGVRAMMKRWADASFGMLGRSPDYLNRALTAFAMASPWFEEAGRGFGANVRRYYEYVRENDLCLTHTLINPQANRSVGPSGQADPFLAARIVKETDSGVVVRGARMLATLPMADEILVFPSTLLKGASEDAPYAFAFAIPCSTPGLKFIARESFDYGKSAFDHPLGSRFEEMDCVVIFDDVQVPWERIFLLRDVERCNRAYAETGAVVHMAHQVVVKNVAKTEFILGLACLIVDAIAIEPYQHVQEKVTEIIIALEAMRAFLRAAEADAQPDAWGHMTPAWPPLNAARNLYPRVYPRLIEILQLLGASGLMAIPQEADVRGPLAETVRRYYQAARMEAVERIKLFRLAWDTALSAFGSRQVLYERFFFGDPVRMAGAMFASYDRRPYMERVRAFLERMDEEEVGGWVPQARSTSSKPRTWSCG